MKEIFQQSQNRFLVNYRYQFFQSVLARYIINLFVYAEKCSELVIPARNIYLVQYRWTPKFGVTPGVPHQVEYILLVHGKNATFSKKINT